MALGLATDPGWRIRAWAELSPLGALSPGLTQPVGTRLRLYDNPQRRRHTLFFAELKGLGQWQMLAARRDGGKSPAGETGRTIAGTGIHPTPR